jgi:hypothetical protein
MGSLDLVLPYRCVKLPRTSGGLKTAPRTQRADHFRITPMTCEYEHFRRLRRVEVWLTTGESFMTWQDSLSPPTIRHPMNLQDFPIEAAAFRHGSGHWEKHRRHRTRNSGASSIHPP